MGVLKNSDNLVQRRASLYVDILKELCTGTPNSDIRILCTVHRAWEECKQTQCPQDVSEHQDVAEHQDVTEHQDVAEHQYVAEHRYVP